MSQKNLRRIYRELNRVKQYAGRMKAASDKELAGMTAVFKKRLARGETTDALLPEAFAAICEADFRILGMRPYDVQIMGGIALHMGLLAEMNTGEGKTLVATMPLYLNALTGKSTMLVTANDYLAIRDAQEMGPVYRFMGLTVAAGVPEHADERFTNDQKREIYKSDIVYTTHGVVGFDYLFDHLVTRKEDLFMREFNYIIIDEADSVLLDAANTPLVIAGSPRVQSNLYEMTDFFATTLQENVDFETEEKKIWLTEEGWKKAEQYFQIDNLYDGRAFELNRHLNLAMRAHNLFEAEKDYMIAGDGELYLLDNGSGRMMPGVKMRGGIHQAIEAKEKIRISQETRSMASITYQNLFKLFPHMAGMSGTISDAKDELWNVYQKEVVVIPTNHKLRRIDYPDRYFVDAVSQYMEAIGEAIEYYRSGHPVLVVVSTIGQTEIVSRILTDEKIPHNVLNATNEFWEAAIIREAGQEGAFTVATSMAGRGTDIKLADKVRDAGGLVVIGIGRLANTRLERQARGRAGRQGDPGISRFYVSLEDEIVLNSDPEQIEKYISKEKRISKRRLKRTIDRAQKMSVGMARGSRQRSADYDEAVKRQRKVIYGIRESLLNGEALDQKKLLAIAEQNITDFLQSSKTIYKEEISRYILDHISYEVDGNAVKSATTNLQKEVLKKYLLNKVNKRMRERKLRLGEEAFQDFVREATLKAVDEAWIEQVDYLQQLQWAVSGRAVAQKNVIYEYRNEARNSFEKMKQQIYSNIIRYILLSDVSKNEDGHLRLILP